MQRTFSSQHGKTPQSLFPEMEKKINPYNCKTFLKFSNSF